MSRPEAALVTSIAVAISVACGGAALLHLVTDARVRAELEVASATAAAASATLAQCRWTLDYCVGVTKHLAGEE